MPSIPTNWTRGLSIAGCLLVVAIVAFVFWPKTPLSARVYIVGVDHSPPYYWVEGNSPVHGMAVDVLEEAARRIGVRLQWKPTTESLDTALQNHTVDLWPVVSITPERKQRLFLSEPWLENRFALLTLSGSGIQTPEQMAARKLAHLSFPRTRALAERFLPRAIRIAKPSREAAVEAVCTGEADASFSEIRHIDAMMLNRPASCAGKEWRVLFVPGATVPMGIAAHASAAAVAAELRSQILQMAEERSLFPLMERWSPFSATETQSLFALWEAQRRSRLLFGIGMILTAALIAFGWQIQHVRAARRVAVEADAAKSEFLANISHEIRTPMNAIIGMADLAASTEDPAEQREFLSAVRTASRSLLLLLNQVLDFSKLDAGHTDLDISVFALPMCIQDALNTFQKSCQVKGIALISSISPELPEFVTGDRTKLFEICSNLLSNALKFTEEGSIHLSIRLREQTEKEIIIEGSVKDTGIGVPAAQHKMIFEAFRQVDGSMARRFGGTGLGLAICKRLVTSMGGAIWVESEEGQGSTFFFTARLGKAIAKPLPPNTSPPNLGQLRILLAEDNVLNQRLELKLLERAGHSVELATSGREAVDAYSDRLFDIVLMDIQMPDMDGLEATRAIRFLERTTGRHTPIIAMTACAGVDDEKRCRDAGMDGYVSKPIDSRLLMEEIHRLYVGEAS